MVGFVIVVFSFLVGLDVELTLTSSVSTLHLYGVSKVVLSGLRASAAWNSMSLSARFMHTISCSMKVLANGNTLKAIDYPTIVENIYQ